MKEFLKTQILGRMAAVLLEAESVVKTWWGRVRATTESAHNVGLAAIAALEAWLQGLGAHLRDNPTDLVTHLLAGVRWQHVALAGVPAGAYLIVELAKIFHK